MAMWWPTAIVNSCWGCLEALPHAWAIANDRSSQVEMMKRKETTSFQYQANLTVMNRRLELENYSNECPAYISLSRGLCMKTAVLWWGSGACLYEHENIPNFPLSRTMMDGKGGQWILEHCPTNLGRMTLGGYAGTGYTTSHLVMIPLSRFLTRIVGNPNRRQFEGTRSEPSESILLATVRKAMQAKVNWV